MSDTSNRSHLDQPKSASAGGLGDKARQFADEVKTSAASHAEDGKAKGADRLAGAAETVDRVADQVADQSPAMAGWVRKAAIELDVVSRNIKDKSVGDLLTIGKDFARREPAAFIAASAIAGFALSRLLKSSSPASTSRVTASSAPERLRSDVSDMAYHPGDPVRPDMASSSSAGDVARPDPSISVQPADLVTRTRPGAQFPLDAKNPAATGDGDLPK